MGGQGSTRWNNHQKKRTVEDTATISIHALHPYIKDVKRTGRAIAGKLYLSLNSRLTEVAMRATLAMRKGEVTMRLQYNIGDPARELDYWITLQGQASNLVPAVIGRWYFVCPECDCCCTKLYLPPSTSFFACRTCHDLTYRSSQEEHRYDGLIRISARELGLDEDRARRAVYALLKGG